MPHVVGELGEHDPVRLFGVVRIVEQVQLDAGRVLGEEREVHALAVPGRA